VVVVLRGSLDCQRVPRLKKTPFGGLTRLKVKHAHYREGERGWEPSRRS